MMKNRKVFAFGLALLMALAAFPLAAFTTGEANTETDVPAEPTKPMAGGPESPTSKASAGRFTTDVDNVVSTGGWGDVSADKWLAFAGWDNKLFSLGYARKIGGLYLGAWYNGNIVAGGEETTEYTGVAYDAFGNPIEESSGYDVATTQPWTYTNNRLSVLLGIAKHGIRLDVKENYLSRDIPTAASSHTEATTGGVSGNNDVTEYKFLKGWTDIYAGWATSLPVGALTIKPRANLGVMLYSDDENAVSKVNSTSPGSANYTAANTVATAQAGKNTSFIRPAILAGAGLSGLPGGFGLDLEYAINFDIYTSSYDLYGGSGSVAGTAEWAKASNYSYSTTTPATLTSYVAGGVAIEEKTRIQHIITPAFTKSIDLGDRVKLGLKVGVPVTLGSATSGGKYTETWSTTTTANTGGTTTVVQTSNVSYTSGESETSLFKVAPSVSIGAQFAAIPNRLTINLGLKNAVSYSNERTVTKPVGIGYTTSKTTVDGLVTADTKTSGAPPTVATASTAKDTASVKETLSDLSAAISAGFTFQFSPNFLVDAYFTNNAAATPGTTTELSLGYYSAAVVFTIKK
jgi:hypothetical protein